MRKSSRVAIFIASCVIVTGLFSCHGRSSSGTKNISPPAQVESAGTYVIDGGQTLSVTISNDLVYATLAHTDSDSILFEDYLGSAFSRWIIHIESLNEVWVYSGDIGTWVWKRGGPTPTGFIKGAETPEQKLTALMPARFREAIGR